MPDSNWLPAMPNPYSAGGAFYQGASALNTPGLAGVSSSVLNGASLSSAGGPAVMAANEASGLLGSIASGVFNMIGASQQRKFEREEAEKQRDWNAEQVDKQNAWSLDMWNRTNEYNSPSAQVARLREAGLNPLYYGLDGSSASNIQSAQTLGYDRANIAGIANPLAAAVQGFLQSRSLSKDMELKSAQIDKLKSETSSVELDNEFKDKTMAARVESESLANNLTREQIDTFKKQREVMQADIDKKLEETKSEIEKQALLISQKALNDASVKEIYQLLPMKKLLIAAQTRAQEMAASASYVSAMYQFKLINSGYIDAMVATARENARRAGAEADNAEINKALNDLKLSLKNGTYFTQDDIARYGKEVSPFFNDVLGGVFQMVSLISDSLGGSLVPLVGGFAAGKYAGKSAPAPPTVDGTSTISF